MAENVSLRLDFAWLKVRKIMADSTKLNTERRGQKAKFQF